MSKPPITLIHLSQRSKRIATDEMLARLGHKNVRVVDGVSLQDLNTESFSGILILQIYSTSELSIIREKSVIKKLKKIKCLVIINAFEDFSDHDHLGFCSDILSWPCNEKELAFRIDRLCADSRSKREQGCKDNFFEEFMHLNMVGNSPLFTDALKTIRKISFYDAPVLIEGETGTGKEMAARAIHYLSPRRDYPFIPVNCGAIPDTLLENELFGHEKGAFTDAKNWQNGLVCQADKGTLFLDEVEAFSLKGQVVLLRFLQDHSYRPLGCDHSRLANVRVIAASNSKLSDMVKRGLFRQDLLYRLNVVSIDLPPLHQRPGDIELLAEHFLDKLKRHHNKPDRFLHPDSMEWLKKYSWPGNVRELENIVHREFLLTEGPCIRLADKSPQRNDRRRNTLDRRRNFFWNTSFNEAKTTIITEFEKNYLSWLMKETNGNVTHAAKRAGKERRALGKLLKKHAITKDGLITD